MIVSHDIWPDSFNAEQFVEILFETMNANGTSPLPLAKPLQRSAR